MTPQNVIEFWFLELQPQQWWVKDPDVDSEIAERFSTIHFRAGRGELWNWRASTEGRLAEIIVLDQFSRNLYRDDYRAYSSDALALGLSQEALSLGIANDMPIERVTFLYMPFMHSESLVIQKRSLELHSSPGLENRFPWAVRHHEIIERFGRFPHRNTSMNRESTEAEKEFLLQPGSSF